MKCDILDMGNWCAECRLDAPIEPEKVEPFLQKKTACQEEIEAFQEQIKALKEQRKLIPHHIKVKKLPEKEQFEQLSTQSKHFIDTIKMIAYRAETAMTNLLPHLRSFFILKSLIIGNRPIFTLKNPLKSMVFF